jgi:hypothetical protein
VLLKINTNLKSETAAKLAHETNCARRLVINSRMNRNGGGVNVSIFECDFDVVF